MSLFNILLVQPDHKTSDYLIDLLSENSCFNPVGIASSEKEAIYMMDKFNPHLLILENNLNNGNGLNILRHLSIRSKFDKRTPDVIVLTEDINTEIFKSSMKLGVFDYIVRPLHKDRINASLKRYLRFISATRSSDIMTQKRIDELLTSQITVSKLPSGIDELTFLKIKSSFPNKRTKHTAVSLSEEQKISKTTARRYLEFAVSSGFLETNVRHGSIGRPEREYYIKSFH